MKKKLTIGVFLALAVVLVASIVGVGVADAVKPIRTVTADITATTYETECNLSANIVWENYGAWEYDVWWYKDSATEYFYSTRAHLMERIIDGDYTTYVPESKDTPCTSDYRVEIQLNRKGGKHIRGAFNSSDVETCNCS